MRIDVLGPTDASIAETVEFARRAEAAGAHGVGFPDHLEHGRDGFVALALAAKATSTLDLYPAVTNVLTRHPFQIAVLARSMQEIAGPRFKLVVGAGGSTAERTGQPPASRSRLRETVATLKALLRGDSVAFGVGGPQRIDDPAPPGPPVQLVASGPKAIRLAGEIADGALLFMGISRPIRDAGTALLAEGLAEEIVRGGAEKAREAGIPVLGGHSIDDREPKYGMVAVGEVDPDAMLTNDGARAGDDLVLTKPLGSGIVATAIKAGTCPAGVLRTAVEMMAHLNRAASEAALAAGTRAATDVTGYGLIGHLGNMLRASGVAARIDAARVPVLDGVVQLVADGHVPGGTRRNQDDAAGSVSHAAEVDEATRILLADAQTSGGLVIASPPGRTAALLAELEARGERGAVFGRVAEGPAGRIEVS